VPLCGVRFGIADLRVIPSLPRQCRRLRISEKRLFDLQSEIGDGNHGLGQYLRWASAEVNYVLISKTTCMKVPLAFHQAEILHKFEFA